MMPSPVPPARMVQIRRLLRFASARGFAAFSDLDLAADALTTAGVLLRVKTTRAGGRIFATLTDGRDEIQLVFSPGVGTLSAEGLASLKPGGRVSVTGIPLLSGRTEQSAVPSFYVLALGSWSSPAPVTLDLQGLHREITPRLLMGRLTTAVSAALESVGYKRYEPRLITSSGIDRATEPLLVRFPGRGTDLFLEISPLPQLLYASVMTGEVKLYSSTRLFSRAYRDGFTSPDSPILGCVNVNSGPGRDDTLERTIQLMLDRLAIDSDDLVSNPQSMESFARATHTDHGGEAFTIDTVDLEAPITTDYAYDVRRQILVQNSASQIIIEGHEGLIAQAITYHWLCIHVERLALGDFWRIRQRRGPESIGKV